MNPIRNIAGWLITILVPLLLLTTAVRLMISPLFLEIEYRTPAFPADTYGFTFHERLHYGRLAVDYLLNDSSIAFLGNQTFTDGTPLYNERELSHMFDVKVLVQQMIVGWYVLLLAALALSVWAWRGGWLPAYWLAVARGGWLTIGLIFTALIFVALNFEALFTSFHEIFFEGGTWTFAFSDTLIRLFPLRFWRDAFIAVGGFTLITAFLLGIFGRRWSQKSLNKE